MTANTKTVQENFRRQVQEIRREANQRIQTQLLQKVHETCFEDCVQEPGSHFSTSQKTCISNCMSQLLESRQIAGTILSQEIARLEQEKMQK
mmetsp:Transcript_19771/g.30937  ORF Transcript_19771/g.30937 Transcript_19771/m.30937 type:complete len:92 (+) Transcript_19771:68-343(+)